MRGHPEQIDQALAVLGESVVAQLTAHGWLPRQLDRYSIAIMTRPTQNGVMTTAEIDRRSFGLWHDDWPVQVRVSLGRAGRFRFRHAASSRPPRSDGSA